MSLILAACGSLKANSPSTTTPHHIAPTVTTPTVSATSTPGQITTGAECQNGQINVGALFGGVGAGSAEQVISFTNVSKSTCTLTGYPGVAALDAQSTPVDQAQREAETLIAVTLAPGQMASATVSGSEIPMGNATSCPYYSPSFLVTPPNLTESTRLAITGPQFGTTGFPGCEGLHVNVVVLGSTGTDPPPNP